VDGHLWGRADGVNFVHRWGMCRHTALLCSESHFTVVMARSAISDEPRTGSRVERSDPLHLLARCHKM